MLSRPRDPDAHRLQRLFSQVERVVQSKNQERQLGIELGILRLAIADATARGAHAEFAHLEGRLRILRTRLAALPSRPESAATSRERARGRVGLLPPEEDAG